MKIDFVSDVSCPWCVVGLKSLEAALASVGNEVAVDLHFQPFELNPQMGPEGQDIGEHIAQKYGSSPADMQRSQEGLKARGRDNGPPGLRTDYSPRYYAAFLFDPDGNNVEAVCLK